MLRAITCHCGGAPLLVRKTLKKVGNPYWLDFHVYQGREHLDDALAGAPEKYAKEIDVLRYYVSKSSTYAVLIGWDDNKFVWADIHSGNIQDRLDAELIAESYA